VATRLRCGGIFNNQFIANLLLSLAIENFENFVDGVTAMSLKVIAVTLSQSLVFSFSWNTVYVDENVQVGR